MASQSVKAGGGSVTEPLIGPSPSPPANWGMIFPKRKLWLFSLKKLNDETGMFGSISDEEIAANLGKTYQDVTALRNPLLGYGLETSGTKTRGNDADSFEAAALDGVAKDYSPNQPRDDYGRWTSGGGGGKIGKTKYAPSPQRSHKGIQIGAKKYAKLCGTLGTQYPGLNAGEIRYIRDSK